jgi:hypothetical protein
MVHLQMGFPLEWITSHCPLRFSDGICRGSIAPYDRGKSYSY